MTQNTTEIDINNCPFYASLLNGAETAALQMSSKMEGIFHLHKEDEGVRVAFAWFPKQRILPHYRILYSKYLDFTPEIKSVMRDFQDQYDTEFLFVADANYCYLYDTKAEWYLKFFETADELDGFVESRRSGKKSKDGDFGFLRSETGARTIQERAEELAGWVALWSSRFGSELDLSREYMRIFFYRLIYLRGLHLAGILESPDRPPYSIRTGRSASPMKFGDKRELFSFLADQGISLFAPHREDRRFLKRCPDDSKIMQNLLGELRLISRKKFTADMVLEAFGEEDIKHKSHRFSLQQFKKFGEGYKVNDVFIPSLVEIDIEEYGYQTVLDAFTALTGAIERFNAEWVALQRSAKQVTLQPDIFNPDSPGVADNGVIEDSPDFILNNVLKVRGESPDHLRLASLLLSLRMFEHYAENSGSFQRLFPLDKTFS